MVDRGLDKSRMRSTTDTTQHKVLITGISSLNMDECDGFVIVCSKQCQDRTALLYRRTPTKTFLDQYVMKILFFSAE